MQQDIFWRLYNFFGAAAACRTNFAKSAWLLHPRCGRIYLAVNAMRKCWNRQTGTFEVRVSMTCGFKSHLPHHLKKNGKSLDLSFFFFFVPSDCRFWLPFWRQKSLYSPPVPPISAKVHGSFYAVDLLCLLTAANASSSIPAITTSEPSTWCPYTP